MTDLPASGWFWIDNRALEKAGDVPPIAWVVYMILAKHADDDRCCFPRVRTIAEIAGVARSTAQRALGQLIEAGLIESQSRKGSNKATTTNVYKLTPLGPSSSSEAPPASAAGPGGLASKAGAVSPVGPLKQDPVQQDPPTQTVSTQEDQGELFSLSSDNGKPNVARKGEPDLIRRVLEYYRDTYHPRALPKIHSKLKPWQLAKARMTDGFTEDDLRQAIDGCHVSPFHCGENPANTKYLSIEVIFRDAKQVQKFIEIHESQDEPILSEQNRQNQRAGKQWLEQGGLDDAITGP